MFISGRAVRVLSRLLCIGRLKPWKVSLVEGEGRRGGFGTELRTERVGAEDKKGSEGCP